MVGQPADWGAYRNGLVELVKTLFEAKRRYTVKDARAIALANCQHTIESAMNTISVLELVNTRKMDASTFAHLVQAAQAPKEELERIAFVWGESTRRSIVVLYQFHIEVLFKDLVLGLNKVPVQKYWKLLEQLFGLLAIDKKPERIDQLYLPAMIRNSYHSNGLHTNDDKVVTLDGVNYEFRKNAKVQCAGWPDITRALKHSILNVIDILGTPEVSAVADPLEDKGAWA